MKTLLTYAVPGFAAVCVGLMMIATASGDDIPIAEGCGPGSPAGNADGDGNGANNDRKLFELAKDNGTLQLWCIANKYYALQFQPAGAAFGLIGKCPWVGGQNTGSYTLDGMKKNFVETVWSSDDDSPNPGDNTNLDGDPPNGDDDSDGKTDRFRYTYTPATNSVTEGHFEAPHATGVFALQGDGAAAHAPKVRQFGFGDLRPLNPFIDNPGQPPAIDPCDKSQSVGGIAGLLGVDAPPTNAAGASGGALLAPIAAAVAVGVAALAAGGWYARRRWVR